jgi:hypothetical protein
LPRLRQRSDIISAAEAKEKDDKHGFQNAVIFSPAIYARSLRIAGTFARLLWKYRRPNVLQGNGLRLRSEVSLLEPDSKSASSFEQVPGAGRHGPKRIAGCKTVSPDPDEVVTPSDMQRTDVPVMR